MNKILELREKRAKAWEAAKTFLDTKRGSDGFCHNHDIRTHNFSYWFKKWKQIKSEAPDGFIAITPGKVKGFQAQYRLSYPNGVQLEVCGVGLNQLAKLINL